MSKSNKKSKLNSPINEGVLKQEMYFGVEFESYDKLVKEIEEYIK